MSGMSGHVRLMSGMCPVQCPVRCPIMSGSMSEKVSENVRCCPMMSGPFWTVARASLSGCVRSCPVVSGRVRSCPIMYHGGLWGCPLVYNTTIAPSQRATWRASMSRALWHNAEMQDGVKCFLAVRSQLSLVHFTMVVFGAALPLVYSTTIAPCGATELTSFAQVSSAQAGSGTACHVTMCPFAFTVDDSHTALSTYPRPLDPRRLDANPRPPRRDHG